VIIVIRCLSAKQPKTNPSVLGALHIRQLKLTAKGNALLIIRAISFTVCLQATDIKIQKRWALAPMNLLPDIYK
jgi:hypothetical protein